GEADLLAAAPVAGDRAEGWEADDAVAAVAGDPVDPGPADDRDAPAVVRAGAKHGEGVVGDDHPPRPAAAGDRLLERALLLGQIRAGQQDLGPLGDRAIAEPEPGLAGGVLEQALEDVDRSVQSEAAGGAPRPADAREHLAVGADEREVGLGVAAVDGEPDRLRRHRHASSATGNGVPEASARARRSSSSAARPYSPTSGCARSARRAVTGSRL